MSVIQQIRDKYARWAVIAIAVSLLGFILMDAFAGKTGLLSGREPKDLGEVDGHAVSRVDFEKKVKAQEDRAAQQGYQLTEEDRQQLNASAWDQEVNEVVMKEQYEKLGLTVSDKELDDILYGANPPQDIRQGFTDEKGVFNAVAARQEINKKLKDPTAKPQIEAYFDYLRSQRLQSKYMALLTNSVNYPNWFLEKQNSDNSLIAKISYVQVPYSSIADNTVKISDDEINSFIKDHKDQFEQKEETRGIQYVLFDAAPNSGDSAATRKQVEDLRGQFTSATDMPAFLNQQSAIPYNDIYYSKTLIQVPAKDSIFALPKGGVYGPYIDGGFYNMAKLIDSRVLPDSVEARHILIATVDPQSGQPTMPDSVAKVRADSIENAIKGGANFDTLETKYSSDKNAHLEKGVMKFSSADIQGQGFAKEFGQFILFDGKPGDKKVVKTQFGYHYIEIMRFINPEEHYKVAYLSKQIFASPETEQSAQNAANMFAGDIKDSKTFNEVFDKNLKTKGYSKLIASNITPMAYNIQGVPAASRSLVKKIFAADGGDVIGPDRVGDKYIVAVVTEINKAGLQSAATARQSVEPILRNKKKAEQIIKNLGKISTLESAAASTKSTIQTVDSVRFGRGSQLAYETRVIGAAFNPANKGKVVPEALEGTAGVYVVRVDNVSTAPIDAANIDEQRKTLELQAKQGLMSQLQQGYNPVTEALKRSADIKDNRAKFY